MRGCGKTARMAATVTMSSTLAHSHARPHAPAHAPVADIRVRQAERCDLDALVELSTAYSGPTGSRSGACGVS